MKKIYILNGFGRLGKTMPIVPDMDYIDMILSNRILFSKPYSFLTWKNKFKNLECYDKIRTNN